MRCGRAGLLDAAAESSLVVFGVSVWDTSRVILVGDELSPVISQVLRSVSSGCQACHRWFSSGGNGSFCMSLRPAFSLHIISHLAVM